MYGDNTMLHTNVFELHKEGERWLQKWEDFIKQDWDQHWASKTGAVWWLSVDCSKDSKSSEHVNRQYLEDYHWRFEHAESLCKNHAKTIEWWPEKALHAGVSGHHWVSSNWIRRWWWNMEQLLEVSDYAEARECKKKSKVKVMLIMFFNVKIIINTEFLLQGDPAVYALFCTRDQSCGRTNSGCFNMVLFCFLV